MDHMKDYRTLLKELPSNTVVCALGDFDPPTTAHELLVKTVRKLAEQRNSDHVIFTSHGKNGIIQEDKKSAYLNLMFPKTNFKSIGEAKLSQIFKQLNEKYKNVIVVAGGDTVNSLKKAIKESQSFQFISIGDKDPDADYTKMKQFATKGIYEQFKKKLPSSIREIDGRRLMNEVRAGLGLEPVKEQLNLVKDDLREQYFRGEIFNVGELVESAGVQYTIAKRGSNHLLLKTESGEYVSKWLHDVQQIQEGVIQPNGTDKVDTNAPENNNNNPVPKGKGVKKGFLTFYSYTKDQPIKEQYKTHSVSDDDKDSESDLDAVNQMLQKYDPSEVGHTRVADEKDPKGKGSHHLRRMKIKHQLGEQTSINPGHAVHPMRHSKDKAARDVAKAQLLAKQAKEKENLHHKQENEREKLRKEENELDKTTPSAEEIAAKHNVPLEDILKQIHAGTKIEHEHATSDKTAEEIARDHLAERPDYYKRLKKFVEHFAESKLNPNDPHGDYAAKKKALQDIQLDPHTAKDPEVSDAVVRRKQDLEKEYQKVSNSAGGNPTFDPFFKEEAELNFDLTDSEIDAMVESVSDEDIESLYEENEILLVYEDTGEEVEHHPDEAKIDLMEVLSRQERLKGKIRLRKTAAKRSRSTKIALQRFSNPQTINKRARRLAIKLMKKRILRGRDPSKVSVGEKERIEKMMAKRKDLINRIAQKLVTRIRKVEKSRMSHGKVTKGNMPSVF